MRTTVAASLALTLVAWTAGCLGEGPSTPLPAAPELGPVAFEAPVLAGTYPNQQGEAFVEVSPDGQTVLTCAHGEFRQSSPMYASTDGGTTWRTLTPPLDSPIGGDCEVALSGDTWVFLASTVASATVLVTQDQGATWSVNPLSAIPTNGLADRPWIAFAGDRLLISYMPLWMQPGLIATMASDDLGQTWSMPVYASAIAPGQTSTVQGHFLVDPSDGTVRIPLVKTMGTELNQVGPVVLSMAVSRDQGTSWTEEPVRGPFTAYFAYSTAVAQGGDGTLYWPFLQDGDGGVDTLVLTSTDGGATWSEPVRVVQGQAPASIPWGHGRPDGSMDLVWTDDGAVAGAEPGPSVLFLRLDARHPGLVTGLVAVTAVGVTPEFSAVGHDGDGRAFVVVPQTVGLPGDGTVHLFREVA